MARPAACDDDYSEPFGGGLERTVGLAAATLGLAAAALSWVVEQRPKDVDVEAAGHAARTSPPLEPPPPEVTKQQVDDGYTGPGRYEHQQDGEVVWTYVGGLRGGKPHGQGELTTAKKVLSGTFADGHVHGEGEWIVCSWATDLE